MPASTTAGFEIASSLITIDRVDCYALTARPPVGPVSSLGKMPVRNALLIRITSTDGAIGWGEIWCNFPPRGLLTRMHLLEDVIVPQLIGQQYNYFKDCREKLQPMFTRMAIHTGEYGPFTHCFAGIDTALGDLFAKVADLPLSQFLSTNANSEVYTYASTPNVDDLDNEISSLISTGHKAVKLKIGNGVKTDSTLLKRFMQASNGCLQCFADANQKWSADTAVEELKALAGYPLGFIEEPIRADAPFNDWAKLSAAVDIPLAAGENITSRQSFIDYMDKGKIGIVQPDIAKWGGVSGTYEVGQLAKQRGVKCAIHYMGSGLGLAASIHTLAAIGSDGPVELDANPNPLRTDLGELDLTVTDGKLSVPTGVGHGFTPDENAIKSLSIASFEMS